MQGDKEKVEKLITNLSTSLGSYIHEQMLSSTGRGECVQEHSLRLTSPSHVHAHVHTHTHTHTTSAGKSS